MDYAFDFLLVCHLLALVVGATTAIAMPIIGSRMAAATPEGRQVLGGIVARLGSNSRIAIGVLLLTGILMVWLRYGGVDGMNVWFWVKMALVAVIIVAMIIGALTRGRVNPGIMGWITRLSLLGVVIAAVLAFN
jgi:putative membrane protein